MNKIFILLLFFILILTGCNNHNSITESEKPKEITYNETEVKDKSTKNIVIYRSDSQALNLVKEEISPKEDLNFSERIAYIFDLLKQDSIENNSYSTVPDYVKLINFEEKNNLLTLNFSKEIYQMSGSTMTLMFVDSVNKTMFEEFPNVSLIRYQVEGENMEFLDQIIIYEGFTRE